MSTTVASLQADMKLFLFFMKQISDLPVKIPNTSQFEESIDCIDVASDDNILTDANVSCDWESEMDPVCESDICDTGQPPDQEDWKQQQRSVE